MQIAFLTLFLSLVSGSQLVTLSAGPGVASIEILLDGRSAGRIGGPPWTVQVDLGAGLLPHRLEARALGADGSEVGRAEQWLNLPRPPAEAEIAFEGGGERGPRLARVRWGSRTGEPPTAVHLSLDGSPLAVDAQGRAPHPAAAPGSARVLSAELLFSHGIAARKDVVLTGDWGSEVATELTALPVRTRKPGQRLAERDLQGAFAAGGRPLEVAAVEREPPQVLVVRGPGVTAEVLGRLARPNPHLGEFGQFRVDPEIRFRTVATVPKAYRSAGTAVDLFDISAPRAWSRGRLADVLLVSDDSEFTPKPQLADAAAVAGLHAFGYQVPRAVLLIVANGDVADASHLAPDAVRAYLAALGVPLHVWSLDRYHPRSNAWGKVEDVSIPWMLRSAYERLARDLGTQQIVWLKGRHLPQDVEILRPPGKPGELALVTAEQRAALRPPR